MKNQYVGDVGDYGKYGLLRFLSENEIKIGVNWYLTKNDCSTDGKFREYLKDEKESQYDSEVFSLLQKTKKKANRNVKLIEESNIIFNAVFFSKMLKTSECKNYRNRNDVRKAWHSSAISVLNSCQLIFADPDNGSADEKVITRKNGEKYATLSELKSYYCADKDVVYYCHKGRRKPDIWQNKMTELKTLLPDAEILVLTFHRGTQRSYIFAIHPERYEKYKALIERFLKTEWGKLPVNGKKPPFSREM